MIDPVGGGTNPMNFNPNDVNVPKNPTTNEAEKAVESIRNYRYGPVPIVAFRVVINYIQNVEGSSGSLGPQADQALSAAQEVVSLADPGGQYNPPASGPKANALDDALRDFNNSGWNPTP